MDGRAISRLLKLLGPEDLKVLKAPKTGLLMMSVKDPFGTDFHLGEVLVTEAYVERDGIIGYGMAIGDDPERALAAASIDLLSRAGGMGQNVDKLLAAQAKKIREKEKAEEALVAGTRVSFESMTPG
jgi:alpha-D-ribose 1-methylphosphonate 5-triphosphate synthase subunit PhnG